MAANFLSKSNFFIGNAATKTTYPGKLIDELYGSFTNMIKPNVSSSPNENRLQNNHEFNHSGVNVTTPQAINIYNKYTNSFGY